jgi:ribonucleotide reductase alpha subunit
MNLFIDSPTLNKMNSVHFYTWECGLKTGMYYLRTKPKASAQKFSIAPKQQQQQQQEEDHQPCESCSA